MKTKFSPLTLLLISLSCAQPLSAGPNPDTANNPSLANEAGLMNGKTRTARTISLEATIDAPPEEAFRFWTTSDGVQKFFAPAAKIEQRVGGCYQIMFFPAKDPEGMVHGTKGARILKFLPARQLAFEWITFAGDELLGDHAPPYAPAAERDLKPLPTWVELNFEAVHGQPNRTHLRFAHYGFRDGEQWEKSYRWFERAWKGVLDELTAYCAKQSS